ncbi:Gag protease polyprotein-like protein [Gossypium australe]|uniref:Gag protease polyprotein-like protein n=1 Tax=Gossypium australe TaxID=47621 RepID=A0A5B6UW39_9ROSI|nr:Gag protease polyprotein-like protein [Gossypium australe]
MLGMDWLSEYRVNLYSNIKRVTLRTSSGNEIIMVGESQNYLTNVISTLVAEKLVCKGCDAYLAYILDTNEFPDVFLEELPSLPPESEVEFGIELLSGTALVSIAPYRMAPKELKELNALLQ